MTREEGSKKKITTASFEDKGECAAGKGKAAALRSLWKEHNLTDILNVA